MDTSYLPSCQRKLASTYLRNKTGQAHRMSRAPAVYIMANKQNGTLYVGVTAEIGRRCCEHREGLYPGFTKKYGLKRLVWYEHHDLMTDAIGREKQIKAWKRSWKIELIEKINPDWPDLYEALNQ